MDILDWYKATVGADSENTVAKKARITQGTLNRQRHAGTLSPDTVIAIATAYGADVIEALVILGFITREQVSRHGISATLADATDLELSEEILRRLKASPGEHSVFDR
ncbi:MAG: hypothetical protein E7Z96_02505 [Actinomycetaceae bacterium]|nr:hypothetical protein [Actinomycetaceae bacterium]